jgi:hypothetical protein
MAALHTLAAARAVADMNVELSMDGLAGNFSLILRFNFFEVHDARAIRAMQRQRRVECLVDDSRNLTVSMTAISVAGFAAWRFGIGLGRTF